MLIPGHASLKAHGGRLSGFPRMPTTAKTITSVSIIHKPSNITLPIKTRSLLTKMPAGLVLILRIATGTNFSAFSILILRIATGTNFGILRTEFKAAFYLACQQPCALVPTATQVLTRSNDSLPLVRDFITSLSRTSK